MPNTTPMPQQIEKPLCQIDKWEVIIHPEFVWKVTNWFGDRFYSIYIYRFLPLGYLNDLMASFPEGTDPDDREIMLAISKDPVIQEQLNDYLQELNILLLVSHTRLHFLAAYKRHFEKILKGF